MWIYEGNKDEAWTKAKKLLEEPVPYVRRATVNVDLEWHYSSGLGVRGREDDRETGQNTRPNQATDGSRGLVELLLRGARCSAGIVGADESGCRIQM